MLERMMRAALLQTAVYEEVEADRSATVQAMLVVVIVAVATGIGFSSDGVIAGVIGGIIGALIGWALWAGITYIIGTTLFRTPQTKADWGELARTLGFAQSPGVLKVFGFIPILGPLLFLIVSIWQLVAMIIAIRQALDYTSTWRAIGVAVVGLVPYVILIGILQWIL